MKCQIVIVHPRVDACGKEYKADGQNACPKGDNIGYKRH